MTPEESRELARKIFVALKGYGIVCPSTQADDVDHLANVLRAVYLRGSISGVKESFRDMRGGSNVIQ